MFHELFCWKRIQEYLRTPQAGALRRRAHEKRNETDPLLGLATESALGRDVVGVATSRMRWQALARIVEAGRRPHGYILTTCTSCTMLLHMLVDLSQRLSEPWRCLRGAQHPPNGTSGPWCLLSRVGNFLCMVAHRTIITCHGQQHEHNMSSPAEGARSSLVMLRIPYQSLPAKSPD